MNKSNGSGIDAPQDDQATGEKPRPELISIKIKHLPDDNPDLSWIGEYSNEAKPGAIDSEARGDQQNGQYRYFIPAMTGEDTGNPNSPEEDYQRM